MVVPLNRIQTGKMISNSEDSFVSYYVGAVLLAAIVFGVTHGVQILIVGMIKNHSLSFNPSGLIVLSLFEAIQSFVFFVIGVVAAYIPCRALEYVLRNTPTSKRFVISITVGVSLGILFLPLCAGVSYFKFHEADSPSYLARCAEFALPMIIAGMFGSYAFWRFGFCRKHLVTE